MDSNMLDIVVTLVDEASAGMTELEARMAALEAQGNKASASGNNLEQTFKKTGSTLGGLGGALTAGLTLPIVGIAAASADLAMKFQQSMSLLQTQAGMSAKDVATLSTEVLKLAQSSKFTPDELAQGLYHLASVGMDASTAFKALTSAQKLAATGNADMEDSTQAVTIAWKSGISGAQDFQNAVATINAIVGTGDMRMQQLNQSLGTSGLETAARAAGISFQDMGATLALMTDMTGNADVSATHLRTSLLMMQSPSKQAQKALEDIGITSKQLGVDLQEGGMPKALTDLKTHLEKTFGPTALTSLNTYVDILNKQGPAAADKFAQSSENAASVVGRAFGGSKSAATVMQLVSNLDQLNVKEKQIGENASKFNEDYAATTQTAAYKVSAAWASISSQLIQLGAQVLPGLAKALESVVTWVTGMVTWFEKLTPAQKKLVEFGLLFAALIGPIMAAVAGVFAFIAAVVAVGAPVGIAIGVVMGLAAAGAALVTYWRQVPGFFHDLWDAVAKTFLQVNWGNFGWTIAQGILGPIATIPTMITHILSNIAPVKDALHALHIPGFAKGGVVPGAVGAPTLALVHGGEVVTPPGEKFGGNANNVGGNNSGHTFNITMNGAGGKGDMSSMVNEIQWRLRVA